MDIEKMKANKDVEGLVKALWDEGLEVQWRAARALGEIGDARAVEPLIKALKRGTSTLQDRYSALREEAACALGKIRDARAVEPLIETLCSDTFGTVRSAALVALGEIKVGDAKAIERLSYTLYTSVDEKVKRDAAAILQKLTAKKS